MADDPNFLRFPILTEEAVGGLDPEMRAIYCAMYAFWQNPKFVEVDVGIIHQRPADDDDDLIEFDF